MYAKGSASVPRLLVVATVLLFTLSVRMDTRRAWAANGPNSPPEVRIRWQDFISGPDGVKRLSSLRAAVQKMKSLDNSPQDSADYRRSWQYWANIHGYYGATI
jgi:hypothetical protein